MNNNFKKQGERKITIKDGNVIRLINISEIIHIKCEGYLTKIFTLDNKKYTICKLLKQFHEELYEYGFIRVNHNTLINYSHIESFELGPKRTIWLVNNEAIQISRRKICDFKQVCGIYTLPNI